MLTKEKAADIFRQIRKHSTADEVEALIDGGHSALTRFANNTIHQNVAEENYPVSVRTAFGGRTARATTNKFDDDSLKRVVQASETLAKVQHPDSDLLPMPDSGEAPAPHKPGPAGILLRPLGLTPELRAEAVEKIVRVATRHKLTTAGIFSSSESVEGIFNSRGLNDWHAQTSSEISITMLAGRFLGMAESELARRKPAGSRRSRRNLSSQSLESASPREIPAGKYTVILEPRRCSTCPASCSGISAASRSFSLWRSAYTSRLTIPFSTTCTRCLGMPSPSRMACRIAADAPHHPRC